MSKRIVEIGEAVKAVHHLLVSMPKPSGAPTALPKAKPMANTNGTAANTGTIMLRCGQECSGQVHIAVLLKSAHKQLAQWTISIVAATKLVAGPAQPHTPVTGPVVTPESSTGQRTAE